MALDGPAVEVLLLGSTVGWKEETWLSSLVVSVAVQEAEENWIPAPAPRTVYAFFPQGLFHVECKTVLAIQFSTPPRRMP